MSSHFIPLVENVWFKMRKKSLASFGLKKNDKSKTQRSLRKRGKKKRRRIKRRELMKVLANVQYVLIKGNYQTSTQNVRLVFLQRPNVEEINS